MPARPSGTQANPKKFFFRKRNVFANVFRQGVLVLSRWIFWIGYRFKIDTPVDIQEKKRF